MWSLIALLGIALLARLGSAPAGPVPWLRLGGVLPVRRLQGPPPDGDAPALAAALVVGSAAGLTLQASLEAARRIVSHQHAVELEDVLRDARRLGLAAALARSTGSLSPLLGRLARAQISGAPLASTVAAFAAEERDARRAARLEAARKLPVRLTVPLALLVLPGFVLLTAGPAAVGSLQRLLGPLLP